MNPSAVASKRGAVVRAPAATPDYYQRQGILKLLAIKDSDVRILSLEQCRDAVDRSLHAGGAFLATIPLVALYYGGFIDFDVVDPTRVGQDLFVLSLALISRAGRKRCSRMADTCRGSEQGWRRRSRDLDDARGVRILRHAPGQSGSNPASPKQ